MKSSSNVRLDKHKQNLRLKERAVKLVEKLSVSHQLLTAMTYYDEVKEQCHEGSLLLPSVPKVHEHASVGVALHLDLITAKSAISHLEKEKHSWLTII